MGQRISRSSSPSTDNAAWKRTLRWTGRTSATRRWADRLFQTSTWMQSRSCSLVQAGCRLKSAEAPPDLLTSLLAPGRAGSTDHSSSLCATRLSTRAITLTTPPPPILAEFHRFGGTSLVLPMVARFLFPTFTTDGTALFISFSTRVSDRSWERHR